MTRPPIDIVKMTAEKIVGSRVVGDTLAYDQCVVSVCDYALELEEKIRLKEEALSVRFEDHDNDKRKLEEENQMLRKKLEYFWHKETRAALEGK